MNSNWEIRTLGEVCEFRRGLTYSKSDEVSLSKNAVLRANNIDLYSNSLNLVDIRYISDSVVIPQNKKLVKNSVMICTASGSKSHLGKVAFIDKDYNFAFGGFMGLLVPNIKIIDPLYFFIILTSAFFRKHVDQLTVGANINNLKFSQIESFQVTLPPLEEQKRIVKILDEKFGAIEELKKITEKQIIDVKELFQSNITEVLSDPSRDYEEKTLKEITTILGDGLHGTPNYTSNGEYYFINGNNLSNGKILIKDNTKKVSTDEYLKHKKLLNERTILVSINGTLGNVAFYDEEKVILGKSACYFNLVESVSKDYIKHFLMSPIFFKYAHKEATGATIKNVSLKTMRGLKIKLPVLNNQIRIAKELDVLSEKTNELEVIFQRKIIHLEELKKSYLVQAFSGNL